ncbi:MAG TPA: helix-turn-helix transcriptional regulator [Chloroflexia bacterium]|nr:helix-turn-helix transcriptional regulator [Chloroflexia bacterium]
MAKNSAFGERLRALRKARNLTQVALGEASGLTRSHISRLEAGDIRLPSRERLLQLAAALGTTADDLLAAAGYRHEVPRDDLPDLPVYLRLKYDMEDPRTVAAIDAILERMREFAPPLTPPDTQDRN